MTSQPNRVLITNDDGPPSKESPYIFDLYLVLKEKLGWDVRVVIPSSQKSWIGKAYQIKDTIRGVYYYPQLPDGSGEISQISRPLKVGEVGEWILLDGTPATCTNIALHNLFPGEIDLVISGPNYGRNTSSAFSLSSGTIGAALSGSLSLTRSIALSFGTFHQPTPKEYIPPAIDLSVMIIDKLWKEWGRDTEGTRNGEVDLYSVNLPMIAELLEEPGLDVVWTQIWRNNYGSLFKVKGPDNHAEQFGKAGPDALPPSHPSESSGTSTPGTHSLENDLVFQFSPQIQKLVNPDVDSLPLGTDAWAIHHSKASITPLRSAFAEPGLQSLCLATEYLKEQELVSGRIFKL